MSEDFKRIKSSTVTQCLIEAMEHADEYENILILYRAKGDNADGFHCDQDMSVERINFYIDRFKYWIMNRFLPDGDD